MNDRVMSMKTLKRCVAGLLCSLTATDNKTGAMMELELQPKQLIAVEVMAQRLLDESDINDIFTVQGREVISHMLSVLSADKSLKQSKKLSNLRFE